MDIEDLPVSFAGMNLYLDNGVISVYALLNFKQDTFIPSWIKRIMISGQFEVISCSDNITIVLKSIKLGKLFLPVKTIVRYIDYQDVPDGMDIQKLSYTITYDDLAKMVSEDIEISKLEIDNEEISFLLGFDSEKITEIIDDLKP
ncbi:MAG: hypothetical protein KAR21_18095, partial [Spirochaetales bacterium]|nr:hypothetical protein [Spirochaetales bacterium]